MPTYQQSRFIKRALRSGKRDCHYFPESSAPADFRVVAASLLGTGWQELPLREANPANDAAGIKVSAFKTIEFALA